ncbi:MAG: hypothetical protein AB7J13_05115, partial [Pyrinomonadaceae bacterium]
MKKPAKTFVEKHRQITSYLRNAVVAGAIFVLAMAVLFVSLGDTQASSEVVPEAIAGPVTRRVQEPTPDTTPVSIVPPQTPATRLTIMIGDKHDLRVATGVDSFVIVSPEFASAEIKNRFTLSISAIKIGETMLLIAYGKARHTYIIAVVRRPPGSSKNNALTDENGMPRKPPPRSGSFSTLYGRTSGSGTSVVRQTVDYRQKLSNSRTLRV